MASEDKRRNEPESSFSFGVSELREARRTLARGSTRETLKVLDDDRGVDPYNTSGSFDRKNHWTRVGKR